MHTYDIPVTRAMCYKRLKEKFQEHRNVTDLRTIDMLVVKVKSSFFIQPLLLFR